MQSFDVSDEVVQGLYEASAGVQSWRVALAWLNDAFGSLLCQLLTVRKRTGELLLCEQPSGLAVDAVLDYVRAYSLSDPHKDYVLLHPVGNILHTEDVFPRRAMVQHPFYREFWDPYGVRSLVATKVAEDDDVMMIVGIIRSFEQHSFSAAEVQLAQRYFGHLIAALRIAKSLSKLHIVANVGQTLMEASDRAMFLLGPGGEILGMNKAAERMLSREGVLTQTNGRLRGSTGAGSKALSMAFTSLWSSTAPASSPAAGRTALRIASKTGKIALCALWEMKPENSMGAFGPHRTLLLTVVQPEQQSAADAVFVAALLNLTPAESHVAVLLTEGRSIEDIARMQRVSPTTVRTHLKNIFDKTGTHRQADLVRFVLRACSP